MDDEADHRLLTRMIVEGTGRFQVVGEAGDGAAAIDLARRLQPDLVLLDLRMPGMDGVQALPRLRAAAPKATVYVLSMVSEQARLHEAKMAGAHGFLDKTMPSDRLAAELKALRLR